MNNLLSYCWLVDARKSASDKDLPVHTMYHFEKQVDTFQNFHTNVHRFKYRKMCLRRTSDGPLLDAGGSVLFLILGVASMAYISVQYLNKTCMLCVGSKQIWQKITIFGLETFANANQRYKS